MADIELEAKGLPEVYTVKQKILYYYYKANDWFAMCKNQKAMIKSLDSNFRKREENKLKQFEMFFETSLERLYTALFVYKFNKTEETDLEFLHKSIIEGSSLKWEYLVNCLLVLGGTIKRLGVSDFPIEQLPKGQAWMEGLV